VKVSKKEKVSRKIEKGHRRKKVKRRIGREYKGTREEGEQDGMSSFTSLELWISVRLPSRLSFEERPRHLSFL